jgi:hypothetical protein
MILNGQAYARTTYISIPNGSASITPAGIWEMLLNLRKFSDKVSESLEYPVHDLKDSA